MGRIKVTRLAIYYLNYHLRSPDTNMDDLRGSFSRLKKGIKYQFTGSKRKTEKSGASGREERVDASGSFPQPEAGVIAGSTREREGNGSNPISKSAEPSAAADKNGPDWKPIVSSTAKLLLRGVRDTADALPQLKAVAGGLCFILENCEVRSSPTSAIHKAYRFPANEGKQTGNRIVGTPGQSTCRIPLQACF